MAAESYQPSNILLTGGAGFIGSHVVDALVSDYDYKVVVLDKLDYCASLNNLQLVLDKDNFKFIHGDITSADLVDYIIKSEEIDTVMHFAAQSHVDNSFGNSLTFTHNNVLGTHVLLEVANNNQIKRFIHVSTDEVYGESEFCMSEDMVMAPTNPYAASKAAAECIVKAYYKSFKLPVIITRGNNVYGPRQYPEKLIPKFICRLQRQEKCCLHGDGKNTRNFLYISDVVEAFLLLLHQGVIGEVYNIGTDFEISNLQVAQSLIELVNSDNNYDKYITHVSDRKFNDKRYHINSNRLLELGWSPQVSWHQGLQQTIDWYTENTKHWTNIDSALQPH